MGIIIKFILENIKEKKLRTFMLIFSIMFSSALFFSSLSISDSLEKIHINQVRKQFGTADIMVVQGKDSPSPFFKIDGAYQLGNHFEYIVGAVQAPAFYKHDKETVKIDLYGFDIEELNAMNPVVIEREYDLYPFSGKKIIISSSVSDKYQLRLGDVIDIELNKIKYKFKVSGISQSSGFFQEYGQEITAIIPKETFAALCGYRGYISTAYIKLKNPEEKTQVIEALSKLYSRYLVTETITDKELEEYSSRISMSLLQMVTIVMAMSLFIIYTAFKIITVERLPVIGTFRSIGATRKVTNLMLFFESIVYGIIGGLIGCLLGIGILYLITVVSTPERLKETGVFIEIKYWRLIAAFFVAVFISLISSFIPILKVSRLPVKEVILNKVDIQSEDRVLGKFAIGVGLIIIAILIPAVAPLKKVSIIFDTATVLLIVAAIIILVPTITRGIIRVFEKVYLYVFGNIGILAIKNLRDNKTILNNIVLLAIGVSCSIVIITTRESVMKSITDYSKEKNYQIEMTVDEADRSFESILCSVEGVSGTYGVYETKGVDVAGKEKKIALVQGVNINKFLDYSDINIPDDPEGILKELDQGRNIILTNTLMKTLDVKIGDDIILNMKKGNKSYRVVGIFHSNVVDCALVSERYLKVDMDMKFYSQIYVKTDVELGKVVGLIKEKFERRHPQLITIEQYRTNVISWNEHLFAVMTFYIVIALIIGFAGIANNLLISFIERKRILAVLRSIGMSKRQIIKMILIESLSGGIIGGVIGIFGGILMVSAIPHIIEIIGYIITINYSLSLYISCILAVVLIMVAASVVPALKSSKLNIVQSIKYE